MACLNNGQIRIDIDGMGRLTWLENLSGGRGNVIAEPQHIYRAMLKTGVDFEDAAVARDQTVSTSVEDGMIVVRVEELAARTGKKAVSLVLTVRLDGDHVIFGGSVTNRSESTVEELFFPCVGAVEKLGGERPNLLFPVQAGEEYEDVLTVLAAKTGREELHEIRETYPGALSMGWMMLTGGGECLYAACQDVLFHAMSLRVRQAENGGAVLEMDKMCFVEPGETWTIPEYVLSLYSGSWRRGAAEYARWAGTWRHPIEPTDWMKRLNGYFLVINKQQYGDEIWPYDTLPELYTQAQAHGYDSLGLFGWYHTGHDNNYPDLDVSPTMGGREGLEKGIKAVQAAGGHVTLYYQGHLMDLNSPFYKREGWKWESKNCYGTPYFEFYPKACSSDFLRFFSRKGFSNVCPSAEIWHGMMKERIDWIAGFGADGALYDQIGGMRPYPCFDKSHNHMNGKPSLSYTQGRLKLLPAIRERTAAHDGFAFMSEHITDVYSQFLDCVHGISTAPGRRDRKSPGMNNRPEMFRYCFPETMITLRNPQPAMERRMVNYGCAYGFKFEMELRYLSDQEFIREDRAPENRAYAKKIADFRRKYEDYLLLGRFRADEGVKSDGGLIANVFEADTGRRAILLWNDTEEARKVTVMPETGRIAGWASPNGEGTGCPETVDADSVVLLFVEN